MKTLGRFGNKLQDVQNKEDQVIFGRQRCEELQNGKNTVKTQLYLLAMRGWIT